ncbi:hypothetical protein [Pseudoalteromonas phenolica]|uniref:Uncharacterized protein n=1 Tax=Pseudoalteromonas phenolica TaxID=161398 RepID=A0A0S2K8Y8_9GAMM|nr:hypothetical protein [Pseudoalteromonas phenolica]ALO44482.1 hypothetical protein PP2015_4014 [Pseudoalteromonas phenolica]MBE0357505.1 hypothetical protein [Pseudoalteromonas phenolica O-BC30]RXE98486.1 hypothetical protein D9981_10535 [Pseudoalteromonas phenolica O-BC30]
MELVITGLMIILISGFIIGVTYGFCPKVIRKSVVVPMFKGNKGVRYFMIAVFTMGLLRVLTGIFILVDLSK